jgi:hypothetical protein
MAHKEAPSFTFLYNVLKLVVLMKNKILSVVLSSFFLFFFVGKVDASCTQVASNKTTCDDSTQTVACEQKLPTPGVIRRFCCDTQLDCDNTKAGIQEEIGASLKGSGQTDTSPTCDGDTGISTAIGCIHALGDQNAFLNDILRWAVGVGSGIAFLLTVYAGFMTMTAAGNPERLKAGQELLTSAIAGLILLIFSVFILRFIGIDILGLDKFGF